MKLPKTLKPFANLISDYDYWPNEETAKHDILLCKHLTFEDDGNGYCGWRCFETVKEAAEALRHVRPAPEFND